MRRPRRFGLAVLLAPLGFLWCIGAGGTLAAPRLIQDHPFLLALLSPRTSFVAAATLHVSPWIVVPACVLRLSLGDPLHHELGRRWLREPRLLPSRVVSSSQLARAQRLVRRFGLPIVALVPTGPVMLAAGASGIGARRAVPANVLGTVGRLFAIWWIAAQAPWVADLAAAVTAWTAPMVLTVAASLGAAAWLRSRRASAGRRRHPTLGPQTPEAPLISARRTPTTPRRRRWPALAPPNC